MADLLCNIAKGRWIEWARNVDTGSPANSALIYVPFDAGAATDDQLRDAATLSALLALGTERSTSNWNRKTHVAANVTVTVDNSGNLQSVDVDDLVWTPGPTAGNVTDIVVGYDSDTTGGTDANILPIGVFDFAITPDGSVVTAQINASGLGSSA